MQVQCFENHLYFLEKDSAYFTLVVHRTVPLNIYLSKYINMYIHVSKNTIYKCMRLRILNISQLTWRMFSIRNFKYYFVKITQNRFNFRLLPNCGLYMWSYLSYVYQMDLCTDKPTSAVFINR